MRLAFVLVEPKVPENVGAAARALKTMGFHQLWVVNSDAHTHPEAGWVAHGSDDILGGIQVFPHLQAVAEQADLLVGTTAKPRHGLTDWHSPAQLRETLVGKGSTVGQIALIFGREDRGLSNDELALCHLLTGIPLATTFPSLNLAQAVMLYAWELSGLAASSSRELSCGDPVSDSEPGPWRVLHDRLQQLLPRIGAGDDPKLRGWLHERAGLLGARDVRMMHTLVSDIERTLDRLER
ncbi:MAG: tRNA/rRNA methyltransferase [Hahellaceae bacterium]|nr:tRNA/rRNA methyltransferase [Hahellaceae bacterium]